MYKIKFFDLTLEERTIAMSIQGLANRKKPNLLLDAETYIEYFENEDFEEITLDKALEIFKDLFKGIVIYDFKIGDISINLAFTISAAKDYLVMPANLYHGQYNDLHMIDIRNLTGDYIDKQEKIFDEYKVLLNKGGLIHQVCLPDNFHVTLRDRGVERKWYCFYTGESQKAKAFRKKVLEWANPNIHIYGWTSNEIDFVDDISKYGDYIIPADWSINQSFLNKFGGSKIKQKDFDTQILPNKHYVTIVVSDGDNVQWLERNFASSSTFKQRLDSYVDYPIGWTVAPSMVKESPMILDFIYKHAKKDYFVSGVSGAGYMNPCAFPKRHLPTFVWRTSDLMEMSDLKVVTLLDNKRNFRHIQRVIDEYASHDNIIGGIYEVDPSRYEGGKGKMWFSENGKPFCSVRISLWALGNSHDGCTKQWLDKLAKKVNSFPVDKTSEKGYTVINLHPWSVNIEDLNYFVSQLKDHIQIVKPDEFITLVKENVIHK